MSSLGFKNSFLYIFLNQLRQKILLEREIWRGALGSSYATYGVYSTFFWL